MFLLAVGMGCAGAPATHPTAGAHPSTRYRVGDYVVYEYRGAWTTAPVILRERVTAREGNRLRIDVTAERGSEVRRWVQVVVDTPENQRNNVVDALYEARDDGFVRLPNEGNRDLFRLYEWVRFEPDGPATDVQTVSCERSFGGRIHACTCTRGRTRWNGRPVVLDQARCPDFLWTHGPGGFRDPTTGEEVFWIDVLESGRHADARAEPMEPMPLVEATAPAVR
ncbi:MAG: hypothetical protein NZ898_01095 [Myxococcota bacterium]|nr:hypothetical protein [Myxococcota bacterium]MDW8360809.1 hypothetical protein [Myxococcales bacterium]